MRELKLSNSFRTGPAPLIVKVCETFSERLRGLMFTSDLASHSGILLSVPSQTRLDASIHMFFMNYDIAVIWLDEQLNVVDTVLARKWKPAYFPSGPARWILETHPDRLEEYKPGDQIELTPA